MSQPIVQNDLNPLTQVSELSISISILTWCLLLFSDVFAGWRASASQDIAIDDISFTNCNPKATPPSLNCSFETDLCGWSQDQFDSFDWRRNNGSTASKNTGPMNDHTKGDSSGMHILFKLNL